MMEFINPAWISAGLLFFSRNYSEAKNSAQTPYIIKIFCHLKRSASTFLQNIDGSPVSVRRHHFNLSLQWRQIHLPFEVNNILKCHSQSPMSYRLPWSLQEGEILFQLFCMNKKSSSQKNKCRNWLLLQMLWIITL